MAMESMKPIKASNVPNTRSKTKANSTHSTHIMQLRSALSGPESSLSLILSSLSLRTPLLQRTQAQKPTKNIAIKQMSGSLAKLTIARKRANSECSDSNGGNGSNPKSRKRIRLMDEVTPMEAEQLNPSESFLTVIKPLLQQKYDVVDSTNLSTVPAVVLPEPAQSLNETQIQPPQLPPVWPDDLTDAELSEMFQMPNVYTFPNGVKEYNREMFIAYIKHHSTDSNNISRNESKLNISPAYYTIPPPLSTVPPNIPYNTTEHPKCEYSPDCDCLRTGMALG